jgi:hypothetical protein
MGRMEINVMISWLMRGKMSRIVTVLLSHSQDIKGNHRLHSSCCLLLCSIANFLKRENFPGILAIFMMVDFQQKLIPFLFLQGNNIGQIKR